MRSDLINALLGGVAGTAVMTLAMDYGAPAMMGIGMGEAMGPSVMATMKAAMDMDMAAMVADGLGTGYPVGLLIHVLLGVVVFPVVYVFVCYDWLFGPPLVRALTWGVGLWLVADLVVLPMLGAGMLMANVGGGAAVAASLVAHLLYSGAIGLVHGGRV